MPFVEVNTPIRGLVQLLVALARMNVVDCEEDPALKKQLDRRCSDRRLMRYERDKNGDTWTSFGLLVERAGEGPVEDDCEGLAAIYAAWLFFRGERVRLCISQPRPKHMAHAYCEVWDKERSQWRVWDPSVYHGMGDPGPDFYSRGEKHCCELTNPC